MRTSTMALEGVASSQLAEGFSESVQPSPIPGHSHSFGVPQRTVAQSIGSSGLPGAPQGHSSSWCCAGRGDDSPEGEGHSQPA